MEFFDTHAHIQFKNYKLDPEKVWQESQKAGVTRIILVGCDLESSLNAVKFAKNHENVWAAVGIHPHNAKQFLGEEKNKKTLEELLDKAKGNKVVAIGEFGLDYFYENSPKEDQVELLKYHLELVHKYNLPTCFHIRSGSPKARSSQKPSKKRTSSFSADDLGEKTILEDTDRDAFSDFWPIFDEFNNRKKIKGIVHCFSAHMTELEQSLERNLYVALNGIMTFTKDNEQLEAAKSLPLSRMLLETDAPFLTPTPFRGKICEPKHVVQTAEFLSELRGEKVQEIADRTTDNAKKLFNIR